MTYEQLKGSPARFRRLLHRNFGLTPWKHSKQQHHQHQLLNRDYRAKPQGYHYEYNVGMLIH